MEHDLQVSRKCYTISRNLGNLINLIFVCKKACFWCESEGILGVNPINADHRDLKLSPGGAGPTIAS